VLVSEVKGLTAATLKAPALKVPVATLEPDVAVPPVTSYTSTAAVLSLKIDNNGVVAGATVPLPPPPQPTATRDREAIPANRLFLSRFKL
jgi:hypothetical protein